MKVTPTLQDYLNGAGRSNVDDNGQVVSPWTEEQWNGFSDEDKWNLVGGTFAIDKSDPRYADVKPIAGGEDGRMVFLTRKLPSEDDVYRDRVHDAGDGVYAYSHDAMTPHAQSAHEAPLWPVFALPLAFMGAGALSGAFDGATAAAGTAGEAAGTAGTTAGTAGTTAGTAGTTAGATGAVGAETGAAGAAGTAGTAGTAGSTTGGIINGARTLGSNVMNWYNGLSAAGRFVVNQGLSAGARAALGARQQSQFLDAQREAEARTHEQQTEAEERARQDHIRRTSVPNFGDAFKPKTPGIIDARRTGG